MAVMPGRGFPKTGVLADPIDPAHPFPFISNLSVNLLVTVRCPETGRKTLIRIKVPAGAGVPRFAQVGNDTVFVPLEDLIAKHLDPALPRCGYRSEDEARMIDLHYVTTIQRYVDDLARKTALRAQHWGQPCLCCTRLRFWRIR